VPKVEKVEKVLGGGVKAIPSTAAAVKKLIKCLHYKIVCEPFDIENNLPVGLGMTFIMIL